MSEIDSRVLNRLAAIEIPDGRGTIEIEHLLNDPHLAPGWWQENPVLSALVSVLQQQENSGISPSAEQLRAIEGEIGAIAQRFEADYKVLAVGLYSIERDRRLDSLLGHFTPLSFSRVKQHRLWPDLHNQFLFGWRDRGLEADDFGIETYNQKILRRCGYDHLSDYLDDPEALEEAVECNIFDEYLTELSDRIAKVLVARLSQLWEQLIEVAFGRHQDDLLVYSHEYRPHPGRQTYFRFYLHAIATRSGALLVLLSAK